MHSVPVRAYLNPGGVYSAATRDEKLSRPRSRSCCRDQRQLMADWPADTRTGFQGLPVTCSAPSTPANTACFNVKASPGRLS